MSTFCMRCGSSVDDQDKFCRKCGTPAAGPSGAPTPGVAGGPATTSTKAIISFVCGLFVFLFPVSVVAIILGHLSLSEIKKSAGRLTGEGLATAGLILGYMGVAGIPIILIIAAIAIPNLLRARMAANESSAVAAIRTINIAEVSYSGSHNAAYACSLSDLGGAQLIDSTLASGQKNGYAFEITACAPGPGGGANQMYQVVARPITANTTGVRSFCSDESNIIRIDPGGAGGTCSERGQPL